MLSSREFGMYLLYLKKNCGYKTEVDTSSKEYQDKSRAYYESFFSKFRK